MCESRFQPQTADGVEPLVDCLVHVGHLACRRAAVAELDLHPVIITVNGAIAVDVLVRTNPSFAICEFDTQCERIYCLQAREEVTVEFPTGGIRAK